MKLLVVSDTHGYNDVMYDVIAKEAPFDILIHCGDIDGEQDRLRQRISSRLLVVAGNNDYDPDLDRIKMFEFAGYTGMITHGHRYRLYSGFDPLFYLAAENHADYVFFGHTHVPVIHEEGPVTLINPGSLTYPRQHGRQPSYIVGTAEPGSRPAFQIKYV
ncbi:MAG: metallophosphoesterase [Lachnospiraceae bacterium]|nr:metallophosphoesterase [Lachnospiraceae bacterium]